jgi:hypothetical protein
MEENNWKLKEGVSLDLDEVARIACALKSLAVYTAMACDKDDNPQELRVIVEEGLDAIERLFDY